MGLGNGGGNMLSNWLSFEEKEPGCVSGAQK